MAYLLTMSYEEASTRTCSPDSSNTLKLTSLAARVLQRDPELATFNPASSGSTQRSDFHRLNTSL